MKQLLVLVAVLMLFPAILATAQEDETSSSSQQCCFSREGYQGICKVTPGEGESCESILEYLNTPETVGKSYCGGNKLRGGWELINCEAATTEDESSEEEPSTE